MKYSNKYNEGYRWYVYISPGNIQYFKDYQTARSIAEFHDVQVKVLEI